MSEQMSGIAIVPCPWCGSTFPLVHSGDCYLIFAEDSAIEKGRKEGRDALTAEHDRAELWLSRAAQAQLEAETARGLLAEALPDIPWPLRDTVYALLAQPATASPLAEENGRLREALRKSRLFVSYSNFSAGYQDAVTGKSNYYTSEEVLAEIDAVLAAWPSTVAGHLSRHRLNKGDLG